MNILSMKTDNFRMSFEEIDDYRYTFYSFGNTVVYVYLETDDVINGKEFFRITYKKNDVLKFSVTTFDMPFFLAGQIKMLYYGYFDYYQVYRDHKSLALQVISVIRCVQNYCERKNIKFV